MIAEGLKFLIRIYGGIISSFSVRSCRFHPTCSAYAYQAIDRHGAWRGSLLALKRISKCHPWNKNDSHDPVPDSKD